MASLLKLNTSSLIDLTNEILSQTHQVFLHLRELYFTRKSLHKDLLCTKKDLQIHVVALFSFSHFTSTLQLSILFYNYIPVEFLDFLSIIKILLSLF